MEEEEEGEGEERVLDVVDFCPATKFTRAARGKINNNNKKIPLFSSAFGPFSNAARIVAVAVAVAQQKEAAPLTRQGNNNNDEAKYAPRTRTLRMRDAEGGGGGGGGGGAVERTWRLRCAIG